MTTNQSLLTIAAGLMAAVVFASAATGPMILRVVLFFLTPLSLYLAGLGIGPAASGLATVIATLAILFITNPTAGVVFAVSAGAPAAYITRLALLGRRNGDEVVEWYPIGHILLAAALFAGAFAALAVALMGSNMEALTAAMRTFVENFVKTEMPQIPGSPPLTEEQITEITTRIIGLMPATLAALSFVTTLLNLWLAGRITLASGRLVRPWPDLSKLSLPPAATWGFLASALLALVSGMIGLIAGGFSGALMLAFAVVGLSIVHALTRGSPWRGFVLLAVYTAVAIITPIAILALAVAGLSDTFFKFRDGGATGPSDPKA